MKVFLFIISFVLFVNCSNNKSELVKAIKNKKEDIEKSKNLTRYLFGIRILIILLAIVGLGLWFVL